MTYSLVSAATIGFDLVRLPAGRHVAEVLIAGLCADPDALVHLAAQHPRRRVGAAEAPALAVRSRRARELAASGTPQLRGITTPEGVTELTDVVDRPAALLAGLEKSMLGGAPSLERLVREDVLDPVETGALAAGLDPEVVGHASDVLADAAIAAYAAAILPPPLRREMSAPFAAATTALTSPAPPDLGPRSAAVHELLDAVRHLDAPGRQRWRDAVDTVRDFHRPWAQAMHESCWAAHVCGRTRTAALALLLAVQAFDDAGFDARDGSLGVWNSLAGCVQGMVLADVVEDSALDVLLEPWTLATGAPLLMRG